MGEEDVPHCWCDKQEKLLVKWAEKAAGYRWLHNHARLYFKKQNDRYSYPSIVIASLTGVGGFAVLTPNGGSDMGDSARTNVTIIQYIFAFLNVIGGILTSLSKFSQCQSLSESHSLMCVQYSKFYRNIDMELSLESQYRVDVVDFVSKAREEFDRLLDDAPDIPAISIHAFNAEFPNKEHVPDVCNGLSIITACDTPKRNPNKLISRWFAGQKRKSVEGQRELTEINIGK